METLEYWLRKLTCRSSPQASESDEIWALTEQFHAAMMLLGALGLYGRIGLLQTQSPAKSSGTRSNGRTSIR
jgi:hypothetical protein